MRLGAGLLLGSLTLDRLGGRLELGIGAVRLGARGSESHNELGLVRARLDPIQSLGQGVEVIAQHVLVPDDRLFAALAFAHTIGEGFCENLGRLLGLARRQLEAVGLAVGQFLEQVLAGLRQSPASPVPRLESQVFCRGALDDELCQGALSRLLLEGNQQRIGREVITEDDADVGHASVLTTSCSEVVHQVGARLLDRVGRFGLKHGSQAADVPADQCLVRVGRQVSVADQVGQDRVAVVQRSAQCASNDPDDVARASVVEGDAQGIHGVDGIRVGSHLVASDVRASSPETIHARADVSPTLADVQLVRLEGLALWRKDQGHSLVPCHDALAADSPDDGCVVCSSAASVAPCAQNGVAALEGRVAGGGQLERGSPVEVVRHGRHELAVDGVVVVLRGAAYHQLVPVTHGSVPGQCARDCHDDGVAISVSLAIPGPRVDVVQEEAQHAVHADVDRGAALDPGFSVGKHLASTVADHQREDLGRDPGLLRIAGCARNGQVAVTGDHEVHLVDQLDLGRAVFLPLRLAALEVRDHHLTESFWLAGPVHSRQERDVEVVRVANDEALDEGHALFMRARLGLLLLAALALVDDLSVGEHSCDDALDDISCQGHGPL